MNILAFRLVMDVKIGILKNFFLKISIQTGKSEYRIINSFQSHYHVAVEISRMATTKSFEAHGKDFTQELSLSLEFCFILFHYILFLLF